MTADPLTGYVRPKVICVFHDENRILVIRATKPQTQEPYYCPLGGRIVFGERSEAALRREIREELGAEIDNPRLLGVLENLFTYDSREGHEIVFVYDADFSDRSLYSTDRLAGVESDGQPFDAIWLNLDTIEPDSHPLYPDGLADLISLKLSRSRHQ